MKEDIGQIAGGWVLTGFAGLCAGLWVLAALPWPLFPMGALLVVHGVRGLRLGRGLVTGHDDPSHRKALARTLTADAVAIALLATAVRVLWR